MKKLGKNLLICLLVVGCFGGVINAMGPLYTMKTKAGSRLVKVNDCVKMIGDAEHGPRVGAIMYIGSSEDTDEDAEEESYVGVEDEEILNNVFAIFKEKYKDEFNFVDED